MRFCNTVQPSSHIFIFGHIKAFRVHHDAGNRCGIVDMLMKTCGARGVLCSLATLLKNSSFHSEFEVFVVIWRGSLKNLKNVKKLRLVVMYFRTYLRTFEGISYFYFLSKVST